MLQLKLPLIFAIDMNNARFATIIHILTLLAKNTGQWSSSDWIAESIQINPVMVRRELGVLHEMGWVASKKGKEGGSKLIVPSSDISLSDILKATKGNHVLGRKNSCRSSNCPIGREINGELDKLFGETDQILFDALGQRSLKSFVDQFN